MNRVILAAASAAILMAGCSTQKITPIGPIPKNSWVPTLQGISQVNLNLGQIPTPSLYGSGPLEIYPKTAKARVVISKLLNWLRQAQRLSPSMPLRVPPFRPPSFGAHSLVFTLGDGTYFAVSYDYVWVYDKKSPNGVGYYGRSTRNVMVWLPDANRTLVYRDPQLAHWLNTGWSTDLRALARSWTCADQRPLSPYQNEISGYFPNGAQWVVEADAALGCVVFYHGQSGGWESSTVATRAFSSPWSGAFIEQAQFVDALRGFVLVGGSPDAGQLPRVLFSTLDGGITWRRLPASSEQPFPDSETVITMQFTSPTDGWLVTVNDFYSPHRLYVYHTTDGGRTWTDTYTNLPGFYGSVPYRRADPPLFTNAQDGTLELLSVPSAHGGNYPSLIFRTIDGGLHWTFVQLSNG